MGTQHWYWGAAVAAFAVALVSGFAEHARNRRTRLDEVGWVPWRGIQVAATFAVLLFLILGFKLGD
jgi:hypothetical protein